ncbi:putative nicotinate-nucleotide adenylyltransferase [Hartmannibacter diazotrophicus]|uniref:nicotinate-nucleotide adenylyltransferase n=2 Tax=Hartmannibacter diazotrophicus TaxID=1482074 RepID=A0A2C9DBA7_9HYPH|nr:putative nicotinate-nucleotide adenylyltransferase [Hartmannibacter diazotrophicus]
MRRARLDRVWWLVTPGNPLKDTGRLPSMAERMDNARQLARHPRMIVTDLEARLRTRYTIDLIRRLTRMRPNVRFVLVIGADNWATIHRWGDWREIVETVPVVVVDRPGASLKALNSPAARTFARYRIDASDAACIASLKPPAWVFLTGRRSPLSSTELRRNRRDTRTGTESPAAESAV